MHAQLSNLLVGLLAHLVPSDPSRLRTAGNFLMGTRVLFENFPSLLYSLVYEYESVECMCICMYVDVICVYMYVHMWYVYACICLCTYMCMYVCACVHTSWENVRYNVLGTLLSTRNTIINETNPHSLLRGIYNFSKIQLEDLSKFGWSTFWTLWWPSWSLMLLWGFSAHAGMWPWVPWHQIIGFVYYYQLKWLKRL